MNKSAKRSRKCLRARSAHEIQEAENCAVANCDVPLCRHLLKSSMTECWELVALLSPAFLNSINWSKISEHAFLTSYFYYRSF